MKIKRIVNIVTIVASLYLIGGGLAVSAENTLTKEMKSEVIEKLAKAIEEKYVLVDKGKSFGNELVNRNNAGAFTDIIDKNDFIRKINIALYDISNDKHLSLRPKSNVSSGPARRMVKKTMVAGDKAAAKSGPQRIRIDPAKMTGSMSMKKMFGLPDTPSMETKVLAGNVGLLTVKDLMGSMDELDKAMTVLSTASALIIDVRECPGGNGEIANQISSYLMPEGEIIMKHRTRGEPTRISKSMELPIGAKRFINKPVYIVTSGFTGSACETLAFAQKYHNRAIIVGEKTAGAGLALTQGFTPVGFGLEAFVPNSAPEHPKYKGGFEKVGVSVDIAMSPARAIENAHQMALSQLISADSDNTTLAKALFESTQQLNKSLLAQVEYSRQYDVILGHYGKDEHLSYDNGQLKLSMASGRKYPLKRINNDLFSILYMRGERQIRIDRDKSNAVIGISLSPNETDKNWAFKMKKA
jgi:hypothetical protein